jgi:hypothetical protein
MAGDWIAIDTNLPEKPEVGEIIDATGESVEVVCFRMFLFWRWCGDQTADGKIERCSLATVSRNCGGTPEYWEAVRAAGWLIVEGNGIRIPGWDERFAKTAKSRMLAARRQGKFRRGGGKAQIPEENEPNDASVTQQRDESNASALRQSYLDIDVDVDKKKKKPPTEVVTSGAAKPARSTTPPVSWSAVDGWSGISQSDRDEWAAAFPGAVLDTELVKATVWLKANPSKAGKRNWRSFLVRWLGRCQDHGGTNRETGRFPAAPPPQDSSKKRYFRSDAQRNMTDAEHAAWRRDQKQGGIVAALAGSVTLSSERA